MDRVYFDNSATTRVDETCAGSYATIFRTDVW